MSEFEFDTAVTRTGDDTWVGEVQPEWRIGEVPNGGYILAIAGRALQQALPHRDPLGVNAYYLAPTVPGPIECRIEVLRSTRNNTHATVKLVQQDEIKVHVTAVYTDLDNLEGEDWLATPRPEMAPWEDCESAANKRLEYRQKVDIWVDSTSNRYRDDPDGSGELRGWLALADGSAPDVITLLMFADAFPPPIFTVKGPVGWVPTLDLSVQIRAKPAPGPVQGRVRARYLTRGVVEEDGEYWDSSGKLVALSRQLAKVRF